MGRPQEERRARGKKRSRGGMAMVINSLALPLVFLLLALSVPASAMEAAARGEDVGMDGGKLGGIDVALSDLVDKHVIAGAAYVITRSGKFVRHGEVGYMDLETRTPFRLDTICRLLSMTKPVGAVAIMKLVEQRKLSLSDPLYMYLPEWRDVQVLVSSSNREDGSVALVKEPALRPITILHLLTHTSGLSYGCGFGNVTYIDTLYPNNWDVPDMTMEDFSLALSKVPLLFQPGSKWRYSYGYDLLGCVLHKVTGQAPDVWIKQHVLDPLGMVDTSFYVPRHKMGRFATSYTNAPSGLPRLQWVFRPRLDYVSFSPPTFISLGAGLVSTATDYTKFAQMLLNGGILDGVRVLSPHTVDLMWRNYLVVQGGMLPMEMNGWVSDAYTGFALGWTISIGGGSDGRRIEEVRQEEWEEVYVGNERRGAVSWGGGAQTNWVANADADVVVTYMVQKVGGGGQGAFMDVVCKGAYDAITGPSPRVMAGGIDTYTGAARKPQHGGGGEDDDEAVGYYDDGGGQDKRRTDSKDDHHHHEQQQKHLRRTTVVVVVQP